MKKFDFLNQNYTIEEFITGITDGDIANFKNDEDFLDFLIYYTYGEFLKGEDLNQQYLEKYSNKRGFLVIDMLDAYEIRGRKLYHMYEICNKDKIKFMRVLHHFGSIYNKKFTKDEVLTNLSLTEPVDFIDENLMFSDGKDPKECYSVKSILGYEDVEHEVENEYWHDLRKSLIDRINKSIKKNNDNIPLLSPIKSYKEEQEEEQRKIAEKEVKSDYEIPVDNLFFGKQTYDVSGGVLNFNMQTVSWFENTGVKFGNYYFFRSIPMGDYCLVDSQGNIFIPDKKVEQNGISLLPNNPIRNVKMASIKKILSDYLTYLSNDPIQNEETILDIKGTFEYLENIDFIKVEDLDKFYSLIRDSYETIYGTLFNKDNGEKQK